MNQCPPISDWNQTPLGHRGCVFILSNQIDHDPIRHQHYAEEMRELWEDNIGCHLFHHRIHLNLGTNQIKQALKELATMDEASQFEYLVVVINAKGSLLNEQNKRWANRCRGILYRPINWLHKRLDRGMAYTPHIMGSDRKWFSESKMLTSFFNNNDTWKGKPKLFILNYCRFAKTSDAYSANNTRQQISKEKNLLSLFGHGRGRDTSQRIPTISDFTLVYGSSSRLLSEIKKVFSDQWKSKSISQMLTTVNEKMTNHRCWSVFESSQVSTFMLTADLTPDTIDQEEHLPADNADETIERLVTEAVQGSQHYPTDRIAPLIKNIIPRLFQQSTRYLPRSGSTLSKGCTLLISNALKRGDLSHEDDKIMMENLWVTSGLSELFDGKSYLNKSGDEMWNLCERFSTLPSMGYEYAVIIVSSHGGLKTVLSRSEEAPSDPIQRPCIAGHKKGFICEHELLDLFNHPESTWHGKVKIFILDYCRGSVKDRGQVKACGFVVSPPRAQPSHVGFPYHQNELPPSISTVVNDSIIVYATHSPNVAYSGGLITAISKVFGRHYRSKSILEMLTEVNAEMKQEEEMIAMSLFKSTLKYDYHLLPAADTPEQ